MQNIPGLKRPSDNPKFNPSQTVLEQLDILADMEYTYVPFVRREGGPLVDYRAVIEAGADTIPGRTRSESLEMIDRAIKFIASAIVMEEDEAHRRRVKLVGFFTLALLMAVSAVWVATSLPQLLLN